MGEAFITRRGGGGPKIQIYEAIQELSSTSLYSTPVTIEMGFTPDIVSIIRTASSTTDYNLNALYWNHMPEDGACGIAYGRSSSGNAGTYGVAGNGIGNVVITPTETGVTIGYSSSSGSYRKLSGEYKIIGIKLT